MMKRILLLLLISLLLAGCHPSTAVILPPDTTATGGNSSAEIAGTTASFSNDSTASTSTPQAETALSSQTQSTSPTSTQTIPQDDEQKEETKPPKQTNSSHKETVPPSTSAPAPVPEETASHETTPEETESQHPVYNISNHSVSSTDKSIASEINRVRAENDLSELTLDKILCALAAIRAYECSIDLGSTRPDGRSWKTVLSDYSYGRRSENAELRLHASGGFSAELLVITWMNTSSQQEKLLDSQFTHVGIGTFYNGSKTYIVALLAA